MTLELVALDRITPRPWREGGGVTRELYARPAGGIAAWQLRISVADVERDGPHSAYGGIDRRFPVVEGNGAARYFPGGRRCGRALCSLLPASRSAPIGRPAGR